MIKYFFLICLLLCPALRLSAVGQPTHSQVEHTLSIIKPDAVRANHIGPIIAKLESAGLRVAAIKMVQLTRPEAMRFYAVHKERPFYQDLVNFMISGPIVVMTLEGPNAIAKNREVMGTTNPTQANPGTIRAEYGKSIQENAVHGSDSPETAKTEVTFFFKAQDIQPRFSRS